MRKGFAIWYGPEAAAVIEALAKREGMTPKEYAHKVLGIQNPGRTRGEYASGAKRVGRPKKEKRDE
jgi:hypothetical protein